MMMGGGGGGGGRHIINTIAAADRAMMASSSSSNSKNNSHECNNNVNQNQGEIKDKPAGKLQPAAHHLLGLGSAAADLGVGRGLPLQPFSPMVSLPRAMPPLPFQQQQHLTTAALLPPHLQVDPRIGQCHSSLGKDMNKKLKDNPVSAGQIEKMPQKHRIFDFVFCLSA